MDFRLDVDNKKNAIEKYHRVAISGTFDVRNYGDLLFPLIAQWRLGIEGIDIDAYSPQGNSTGWRDCMSVSSMRHLLRKRTAYDAFIIGGGNIIHLSPSRLKDYSCKIDQWAYPSLWVGVTTTAAISNRPVLWNAPGVPHSFSERLLRNIVQPTLIAADYVSVRDTASKSQLGCEEARVNVVPDTAVEIARMWPRSGLETEFRALLERKGAPMARFVTIHIKHRSVQDEFIPALAEMIDRFSATSGLTPILLAIGQCHDDHIITRRVGLRLRGPKLLVDDPLGLREIAAAIAFSEHYIGCSMHGYVTAYSYGVSGRIVAVPQLSKYAGFLEHVDRQADLSNNWESALAASNYPGDVRDRATVDAFIKELLDKHWKSIARGTKSPRGDLVPRAARFMRRIIANGLDQKGWDWISTSMHNRLDP